MSPLGGTTETKSLKFFFNEKAVSHSSKNNYCLKKLRKLFCEAFSKSLSFGQFLTLMLNFGVIFIECRQD